MTADLARPGPLRTALSPHGWHYVSPELDQRPWRVFFVEVVGGRRSAHLHVTTFDHPRWHEQIAFRDALSVDPALAARYTAGKRALATEHADGREAYSAAKGEFIRSVLDGRSG